MRLLRSTPPIVTLLLSAAIAAAWESPIPEGRPATQDPVVLIPVLHPPPPPSLSPDSLAMEKGLEYRMVGVAGRTPVTGVPVPGAVATPLSPARTAALLERLPPLPAEDSGAFRFPPGSPPPPRTGATIRAAFPPPDSVAPPAPEISAPVETLEVSTVIPSGEVGVVPEVTVTFSHPMVALTTVAALEAGEVPVRLTPAPPGRWSWVDPRTLRFEPAGRLPMATRYAVDVPAGIRSASGLRLPTGFRAGFSTTPARAIGGYPNRGGPAMPPPVIPLPAGRPRRPLMGPVEPYSAVTGLEPLVVLVFDQAVDPAAVARTTRLTAAGVERAIRVASPGEIAADSAVRRTVEAQQEGRTVVLRPVDALPRDAEVRVSVLRGTPSAEGPRTTEVTQEMYFRTYGPLLVEEHSCAGPADDVCFPGAPWSIRFSNPLEPSARADALVRVEPEVRDLTVQISGNTLLLQGETRPGVRYRVTLGGAISDRFGQRLENPRPLHVQVGDAPPLLAMPGAPFIVLDPGGPPRVLVHARGHRSLRVRIHRVRPEDWHAYSAAVRRFQENPTANTFRPPGELVVETAITPEGEVGDFAEIPIDVSGALRGGLGHAIVEVEAPDATPAEGRGRRGPWPLVAWVQATGIGLSAIVDRTGLIAWSTSLADGRPLSGVGVQLLPSGLRGETGADGLASIPLTSAASNLLVASRGLDTAILPENPHGGWAGDGWQRGGAPRELRWLLFTDRGLYRPGERVHLKGWIRRADLSRGGELALPSEVAGVNFTAVGPREEEIATGRTVPGSLGGFATEVTLPRSINLGHARVQLRATGSGVPEAGRETMAHVRVDEFRRPEYEVAVQAPAGPHLVGGSVEATLSADYFSGGGLGDAEVRWRANASPGQYRPPRWDEWSFGRVGWWATPQRENVLFVEGKTDSSGDHAVRLDFLAVDPPFPSMVRLDAEVGDVNRQVGSAGIDLLVHPARLYAGLKVGRAWTEPGDSVAIEIIAVDLDGGVAPGTRVELSAERVEWHWIRSGAREETASAPVPICTVTSAAEPVRCVWRPSVGGSYRVRAELRDRSGKPSRTEVPLWVAGGPAPLTLDRPDAGAVAVLPDRATYQPGDTAEIFVRSPVHPASAVLTVRHSGVLRTEQFRMTGPTHTLRLPILEAHIPNLHLRVDVVGGLAGTGYAAGDAQLTVPPRVRELDVRISPRDSVAAPGAVTAVEVQVRGPGGSPVPGAEVAVWMVDESILSLGDYQLPDPLAAFYPPRFPDVRDLGLRPYVVLAPRSAGPGTASGLLVGAAMAERLAGVRVLLEGTGLETVTRPDGSFTISGIAPGRHALRIDHAGVALRRTIDVPAGGVHLGTIVVSDRQMRSALEAREERLVEFSAQAGPGAPMPPPVAAQTRGMVGGIAEGAAAVASDAAEKGGGAQPGITPRTRFAPLALFEPALRTGADGRVRVQLRLPESLTRYRVMAVAVEGARRFGRGEAVVTARRELMVRPSPPRFLNYGDRAELPVLLQNVGSRVLTVSVAARGSGIRLESPTGQLVTVPAHDRVEIRFPATATRAGTAHLQVVAVSGAVTDAASVSFPVYTPATAEAFAAHGDVDTGLPVLLPVNVPGGVLPDFGGLEVTVSSTAVQELTDAVLYLHGYPFEGAEQVASRVLGVSALRDVLAAFRAEGLPPPDSLLVAVRRDLERLAALQASDGGWSFWRPDRPSDPFVSVHVAHALQRARENGFALPAGVLERALAYLTRLSPPGEYGPGARLAVRAYALYVRDRAGDPDAAAAALALFRQERGARPLDDLPLEPAAWLLHVLSDVPGAGPVTAELLRTIRNRATRTAATATFVTSYGGQDHLVLHSAGRSDAVVLEALIASDSSSDLIPMVARGLLAHRTRGRWSSTQENSWALLALQRYFRVYERVTPSFRSGVWLGGRFAGGHPFRGRTTERFHVQVPMREVVRADTARNLILAREGAGRMYYRAGLRYAPADLDLDAVARGFTVRRSYEAVDDSAQVRRDQYGNWRVRAGARVRVRVTMIAPSRRHHVALIDPLPGGLEPINPELRGVGMDPPPDRPRVGIAAPESSWRGAWFHHQNLRDDRVEAFASLLPAGTYEYTYLARATTPGTFVVPPPRAEEMYQPETFGRGETVRLIVE